MASEGARPPEPAGEGRPLRVVALARYGRRGASSRLRFYQYGPLLAAAGIRLEVLPLLSDAYLERRYAGRGRLGQNGECLPLSLEPERGHHAQEVIVAGRGEARTEPG